MKLKLYISLIILILISSCGEYEKLLKSTDYELKKEKAKEYYEAGQYGRTTELLEQIMSRYRASDEAEDLQLMNAQSFFGMKDYYSAGTYFKSYIEQFPYGKFSEEATYMSAYCDYLISPRAELDQENTNNAIEGFNVFINRYPASARIEESRKLLKDLEERLVEKSYLSARLYYDMSQYRSAIVALTNSLKDFSDSKYREEMMYLKLSSLYLYAENSMPNRQRERFQDTLDDYYSFKEEYPESRYSKDVERIFQETSKFLKIGNATAETNIQ